MDLRPARPDDVDEYTELMRASRDHLRPWYYGAETVNGFEELLRRSRADDYELLLTSPLTDFEIIIGKFLGAMGLFCAMLVVTMIDVAILFRLGNPEWRPIAAGYLGLLLMGGCFISVGLLISSLTKIFRGAFQNAYLGFAAGAAYAGQGYMREGMELTLRHVFDTLHLHRVEANVQPANERSRGLVERCGFRLEGFSPKYLLVDGAWRDHHRFAITVEDRLGTS